MESFFILLLKSSLILLLFLVSYHFFLRRETFFTSNRMFLIIGLTASLIVPFITITKTTYVPRATMSSGNYMVPSEITAQLDTGTSLNWLNLVLVIYLMGALYFGLKLLFQIRTIQNIKKNGKVHTEDNCHHVRTYSQISPFSFFKYIFYNPRHYSQNELNTIINHEKVHVRQLHSLDILFTEIILILQWFNPVVWFYKSALKQNLEYIADLEACNSHQNKKEYQYLMLKQATGNSDITIANPFFNSIIKKRIVMLNQSKSKRINLLKLLLVLPLLGLFLVGFNTEEIVEFSYTSPNEESINKPSISFISPIKASDIKKVSSSFGPARNPFTKKMDFHNGIDLVAESGKNVLASADGKVELSATGTDNGNYIVIKHKDSYSTKYLHLKDRMVENGDKVSKGQIIGHVGSTGKSTGPHLHFEVLQFKKPLNPESLIPFKTTASRNNAKKTPPNQLSKTEKDFEFVIDKRTSDSELSEKKAYLAKNGIDFSYTIVRNKSKEIIDLAFHISGEGLKGNTFNNSYSSSNDKGISPLMVSIDKERNKVFIGSKTYQSSQNTSIGSNGNQVWLSSVDDNDITVISENEGFFFIDTDGDKAPLYFIDEKKSTQKAVRDLSPNEIGSINVLKGEAARTKYGKAAKNGVVEITTKDEK
ncbi:M23/M56 family metallopeptidase [Flagellimonas meridianipacifica]|uniref:BlaR1 peptidase M56 n=1 Tax=Flagellimonas meridianipacifica TaxID=1080225 RepID=A0A2T0M965_9FLAO|nr:M23/M56 family metallopeptidase [Allomuricauda pacifica]PRX54013.1 BlaR1 peptidase M56 [Allomuricauda pacifica]